MCQHLLVLCALLVRPACLGGCVLCLKRCSFDPGLRCWPHQVLQQAPTQARRHPSDQASSEIRTHHASAERE
ncbi:hypothetical protein M441DRAFT_54127 [Trichoderma asperellum CBS 433.97]|uniref:Secreted protein n=1 Tax=Trichoderma asperellum (strain ATCC 204424 / CBS 433.97 / NBRC 101777) TaxID=1042311 RepID=A0A2T3ZJQ4_TRIA4|nr:hypothetical protein M441DRAFT_54127 [Trichoderma asperellum CBS 433.97]PTB45039.1 hypothetical protein M441DRAFT_54127 [Trichoderma asperellum CBS 433.97]